MSKRLSQCPLKEEVYDSHPEGLIDPEFFQSHAIELLKKHGLDECVSMSIPMATERLDADLQGTPTDQMTYRRMIGGLKGDHAGCKDIKNKSASEDAFSRCYLDAYSTD
ncbi:hypothetical protein Tco_0877251 [Tanacetum coccineum]|uniref:Uncharacterized protein n=1 Tax=Tanacetum coccineum TaxID=301880 RepID=A0ABQ5BUL8_9ASTR